MSESKRIKQLCNRLIKDLPFFPNDRDTLAELENKNLNDILIHFLHWRTRHVPVRPRRIKIAPELTSDKRYKLLKNDIGQLLEKVRGGEDLSPYLSHKAHKNGYTPVKRIKDGKADSWDDKDQLLNTKGFHHFHLNMEIEKSGLSKRTNEVLFAQIDREEFHAMGIFDHSVFDSALKDGKMTTERERMWKIHEKYTTMGMEPGTVYMAHPIMTSGHPLYLIRMADLYASIIRQVDPDLDNKEYVSDLYREAKLEPPKKCKLRWSFHGLDLGLYDESEKFFVTYRQGHI